MFGYYYNSSFRRYHILMMELFNGIQVERQRGDALFYNKVPVSYASKERFVMKLNSEMSNMNSDGNVARVDNILPRINIHMVDANYVPPAKTGIHVRQKSDSNNKTYLRFNPVPWKIIYEVSVYTRFETDMLVIAEQILPYFQPNFTCKIKELHDSKTVVDRDIQITFQSIAMSEDLEGDRTERRRLEWTFIFELDGWLYSNFSDLKGEIKTTYLDFWANEKQLPKYDYESGDSQVVPPDVIQSEWDGSINETMSSGKPIPVDPEPPHPREN